MAQRSKLWYLKNINLFRGMPEEQMRFVEQHTTMREIRRREVLYLTGDAGDRIYLLKRGVVKISTLDPDGREIILALLRPGEVFGEEAVLDDAPRDHIAEAYEDALICVLSKQDFAGMLQRHPDLGFKVTKLIGFRLKTFRSRIETLLFKGAPARLAATLLELGREHGVRDGRGLLLPLKLSQQDLANLIGVTRESVNLALADFRRRGLVEVDGRTIRLLDTQALEEAKTIG
ncbi:MAG: Crp/Fnr family transcriptional regulator [Vicinamibacteria bacterium]